LEIEAQGTFTMIKMLTASTYYNSTINLCYQKHLKISLGNQTKTNANGAYATAQNVDLATTDSTVAGVQVLGAKENNGAGVTVSNLNPDNIKLNIPANTAKAETYKTTLNWTMNDTPGN